MATAGLQISHFMRPPPSFLSCIADLLDSWLFPWRTPSGANSSRTWARRRRKPRGPSRAGPGSGAPALLGGATRDAEFEGAAGAHTRPPGDAGSAARERLGP